MAFLSLSHSPLASTRSNPLVSGPTATPSTSFTASTANTTSQLPLVSCGWGIRATKLTTRRRRSWVVGMAPEEERMTRRSPLDFPIEWERPKPGRRPDIFPQFSPMKTPLPPPMPADPPEEDEEEEEEKKEEEEENPEENPDKPEQ